MLSNVKLLQIANVCYANVSGLFAMFSNEQYRGPNFSWEWFIDHCKENADMWIDVGPYKFRGNKDAIYAEARRMSCEIAEHLVYVRNNK